MELTEAVRIVREQTIPALRAMWRDWYPVHVAALETVLVALEQAQAQANVALLDAVRVRSELREMGDERDASALRAAEPAEEHPFAPCLKHGGPWHIFCGLLCEVCGLPAEKHTAPAEAPLASPDSVPPGVEDLRARHYERINRHAGGDDIAPTLPGCTCDDYAAHAICPVCRAQADGEP